MSSPGGVHDQKPAGCTAKALPPEPQRSSNSFKSLSNLAQIPSEDQLCRKQNHTSAEPSEGPIYAQQDINQIEAPAEAKLGRRPHHFNKITTVPIIVDDSSVSSWIVGEVYDCALHRQCVFLPCASCAVFS